MYLLIGIGINGVKYNEFVSKTKKKLEQYLKERGYYYSKKVGFYIDDNTKNKIDDDFIVSYRIKKIQEL